MRRDVSVIIPSFNRVLPTMEAVKSALNQTCKPIEIIIVDDGSKLEVVKELESAINEMNEPIVRAIYSDAKRHPGIIRNIGISNASAFWIAFLDSDDVWLPTKLEKQLNALEGNGSFASDTGYITSYKQSKMKTNSAVISMKNTKHLLRRNTIVNSSVLVSKDILGEVGNVATSYAVRGVEDYATWLRISTRTTWVTVEESLVVYSDSSPDSIRLEPEVLGTNYFGSTSAQLDFLLWSAAGKKKRVVCKIAKMTILLLAYLGI